MKRLTATATAATLACLAASAVGAADDFDLAETAELCASCHGEDGLPVSQEVPIIWGQQFYYLYVQMKDYKAGRRANEVMAPMIAEFSRDQMKALAQFFADKAWPVHRSEIDKAAAAEANSMLDAGQCSQCHSTYRGDSRVPRLAGQTPEYLEQTMQDFKHRIRMNAPDKNSLIGSFDDEQIRAVSHYLAGL